ncbi:MAG TPA: HAMP domain-containing sensor histidine kinase [Acidimicrobiales bacterium]|nr:HAMP domain-containing sensor histidine kinase [Acidimicrobiales bacterium]
MAGTSAHDELLALAAHELRNPVTAIRGFADTLLRGRDVLSAEQQDAALDAIARQAGRLDRLLGDLLLVAAGASGALALRPSDVALGPAIDAAATDSGLPRDDVRVDCPAELAVWADPDRLAQMLGNHLTNARLHGRPPVTVEAEVVDGPGPAPGGVVEIRVGDAGDGVADDLVPRLYGRFQRGSGPGGGRVAGSGLGLAVVRTLAEASGGSAGYRRGVDGAHCFLLRLPAPPRPTGPPR